MKHKVEFQFPDGSMEAHFLQQKDSGIQFLKAMSAIPDGYMVADVDFIATSRRIDSTIWLVKVD